MEELKTMIILIEAEYEPQYRNTPSKMIVLIWEEFRVSISEDDIMQFYGLKEDFEKQNRYVNNGYYFQNRY